MEGRRHHRATTIGNLTAVKIGRCRCDADSPVAEIALGHGWCFLHRLLALPWLAAPAGRLLPRRADFGGATQIAPERRSGRHHAAALATRPVIVVTVGGSQATFGSTSRRRSPRV